MYKQALCVYCTKETVSVTVTIIYIMQAEADYQG